MGLFETLKSSIKQLLSNKGRTLLTMLGMFIGISAVIMIMALGEGFKGDIKRQAKEAGEGIFQIQCKNYLPQNYITLEELQLIASMEEIECVVAGNGSGGNLYNHKGELFFCNITGVQPKFINSLSKLDILAGRNLNEKDEAAYTRNILISDGVAMALFGCGDRYDKAIGENITITIDKQPNTFNVVGVYEGYLTPDATQKDLEKQISKDTFYIPYNTLGQILGSQDGTGMIAGSIKEGYDQIQVASRITQILNKRHHLQDGYESMTMAEMVKEFDEMFTMLTAFIGAIAGISLVVGGVGIMNIMLVTVKERTREIGVRKALGATNGVILRQFLVEALMLTAIAGAIGVFIGYSGARLIGNLIDIQAQFTTGMLTFSTGTSIAIGIVFGVYPAYQAAKMHPIEALRVE